MTTDVATGLSRATARLTASRWLVPRSTQRDQQTLLNSRLYWIKSGPLRAPRAGLRRWAPVPARPAAWPQDGQHGQRDAVAGHVFAYSNIGYVVLAEVLRAAAGADPQPWRTTR